MKNLILTFILIILTICLVKQMNMKVFNQTDNFEGIQGCNIQKLVNPNAEDFYNCLMKQTNSIFNEMYKKNKLLINKKNKKDKKKKNIIIRKIKSLLD